MSCLRIPHTPRPHRRAHRQHGTRSLCPSFCRQDRQSSIRRRPVIFYFIFWGGGNGHWEGADRVAACLAAHAVARRAEVLCTAFAHLRLIAWALGSAALHARLLDSVHGWAVRRVAITDLLQAMWGWQAAGRSRRGSGCPSWQWQAGASQLRCRTGSGYRTPASILTSATSHGPAAARQTTPAALTTSTTGHALFCPSQTCR